MVATMVYWIKHLFGNPKAPGLNPTPGNFCILFYFAWSHDLYAIGHMICIYNKGHGHTIFTCQ